MVNDRDSIGKAASGSTQEEYSREAMGNHRVFRFGFMPREDPRPVGADLLLFCVYFGYLRDFWFSVSCASMGSGVQSNCCAQHMDNGTRSGGFKSCRRMEKDIGSKRYGE